MLVRRATRLCATTALTAAALVGTLLLSAPSARAQTVNTWLGGGNNANWLTSGNFTQTLANDQALHFAGGTQTTNFNNSGLSYYSLTFDAGAATFFIHDGLVTPNRINLSNGITNLSTSRQFIAQNISLIASQTFQASAGDLVIQGNILGSASPAPKSLTIDGAFNTEINGLFNGTGDIISLIKIGTGTLLLNGVNDYQGATTISAGVVTLQSSDGLGSTTAGTSVASGAALQLQNGVAVGSEALTLNGTGIANGGALRNIAGTGSTPVNDNSWAGAITLGSDTRINSDAGTLTVSGAISGTNTNLTVGGAGNTTLSGGLTLGTGGLTKDGSGTLTLSGTNSYSGTTTISAGTLLGGAINAFSATSSVTLANTAGALLDLGGWNQTVAGVSGGGTSGGNIALGGVTLTIATDSSSSFTYAGQISGSGNLVKSGDGTQSLTGASTYTGFTFISGGVLNIRNATALGTTAAGASVSSGAALEIQGGIAVGAETLTIVGTGVSNGGALRNVSGTNSMAGAITLGGSTRINSDAGTLTLSGGISGTNIGLTVGGAGNTTLSGSIALGFGGLTKDGSGTLILSGTSTYLGDTLITAGVVNVRNADALGANYGGTTVSTGAALEIQGGITVASERLLLNGTGIANGGVLRNVSGDNGWGGNITLGGTTRINSDAGTLTLSGTISGTNTDLTVGGAGNTTISGGVNTGLGRLTKDGSGTLILSGASTYNGTTLITAGVVNIRNSTALGTTQAGTTLSSGAALEIQDGIVVAGEALTLNGTGIANGGALRNVSGSTEWGGSITLASASRINSDADFLSLTGAITGTNTDLTVGGAGNTTLYGGLTLGTGGLTKDGSGTLVLLGTNSYSGTTTISAGMLRTAGTNAFSATSSVTLANTAGAMLDLGGWNQTVAGISGGGTTGGNIETGGARLTIATDSSSSFTYAGQISGSGNLVKSGGGTQTLTGASTYTGTTSVTAGVLNIQNATALGTTAAGTSVSSGAALEIQGGIAVGAESLTLSGTGVSDGGALRNVSGNNSASGAVSLVADARINSDAGTLTLSGIISSTGSLTVGGAGNVTLSGRLNNNAGTLTKDGTGTLVLAGATDSSGTNLYSGATTVSAGVLNIRKNTALGSTAAGTTVAFGAALELQGDIAVGAEALTLNGTGVSLRGALRNISGTNSWAGDITLDSTSRINSDAGTLTVSGAITGTNIGLTVGGAGAVVLSGDIATGTGTLLKDGAGRLTLSGDNSYTGNTEIFGGALNIQSATALGTTASRTYVSDGAALEIQGGIAVGAEALTLAGAGLGNTGALRNVSGDNSMAGDIRLVSNTFIGSTAGTLTLSSAITGIDTALSLTGAGNVVLSGDIAIGDAALNKSGTGTATLSGANSYSGTTSVTAGVLNIQSASALGDTAAGTVVSDGAALEIQGGIAVGAEALTLSGTGVSNGGALRNISGANSYAGAISLAADTRIASDAGTLTLSGGITGASMATPAALTVGGAGNTTISGVIGANLTGLTKNGTGTLTLSAANTYTGPTTISAGTLALSGFGSIASSSAVQVNGTLDVSNIVAFTTINNVSGLGTLAIGSRTLVLNQSTDSIFAGGLTGGGTLAKDGGGTLQMVGDASAFTGTLSVQAGTLDVNNASGTATGRLGGNVTVFSGATLQGVGGTIGGVVTLTSGGTLRRDATAPGTGGLTMGALAMNAGALLDVSLATPATSPSAFTVTGNASLNGTLNITDLPGYGIGVYRILSVGGTITDYGLTLGTPQFGNLVNTLDVGAHALDVQVTSVDTSLQYWSADGTTRGGSGNWTSTNSWLNAAGGASPWGSDTGVFDGTAGTVTVVGAQTFGTLEFLSSGTVVQAGAGGSLDLGTGGRLWAEGGTVTATVSAPITGTGALTKIGTGTIILTGTNTYAGGTVLEAGTLQVSSDANLGAASGALTFTNGRLATTTSFTSARDVVLTGTGTLSPDAGTTLTLSGTLSGTGGLRLDSGTLVLTGTNTYQGGTILAGGRLEVSADANLGAASGSLYLSSGTLAVTGSFATARSVAPGGTVEVADGSVLDLSGALGGYGGLTKTGTGKLILSGASTAYFGGIAVNSGALEVRNSAALGSSATGGTFIASGAALELSGDINLGAELFFVSGSGIANGGALRNLSGTNSIGGTIGLSGATRIASDAGTLNLGGPIGGPDIALTVGGAGNTSISGIVSIGTGTLTKEGTGTLTLAGANTYTGQTIVTAGTLALSGSGSIAASGGVVVNGVLDISASTGAAPGIVVATVTPTGSGTSTGAGGIIRSGNPPVELTIDSGAIIIGGTGGTFINGVWTPLTPQGSLVLSPDAPGASGTYRVAFTDSTPADSSFAGISAIDPASITASATVPYTAGASSYVSASGGTGATILNLSGAGSVVLGSKTLTISNASGSFSGEISGTGGLAITGGTQTLTGANTYTGATLIGPGTLALVGSGSIAASSGVVANGTLDISGTTAGASITGLTGTGTVALGGQTLTLTNAASLAFTGIPAVFSGALTGTGGLVLTGGSQLLAGASSYSGGTTLNGGVLTLAGNTAAGTGTITLNTGSTLGLIDGLSVANALVLNGAATFNLDSGAATLSGPLSGTGSSSVTGAGIISMTGNASAFTGTTSVTGTLSVNGTLGGTLNVGNGGTLKGNGTVGPVTLANGGSIAPGNSIGTLTVAGPLVFSSGSIYEVEIDPTGLSDRIVVNGAATLNGAGVAVTKAAGTYLPGTQYTILLASGGVSGTFGSLTQDMPFINLALSYTSGSVLLDVLRNDVPFVAAAATGNQLGVAFAAEQLGAGNAVYDALVSQASFAETRQALNALNGEVYPSAMSVLQNESLILRRALLDRARAPVTGPNAAPLAYASKAAGTDVLAVPGTPNAFWAQGFGTWGRINGDGNAATISGDTAGAIVGYDRTFAGAGADWRLGFAAGYSSSRYSVDARSSSFSSDNTHVAVYGGADFGALAARFGGAYSWADMDTSRTVAFPGFGGRLSGDTTARTGQVFGELGYRLDFAGTALPGFALEPFAGLAYVNVDMDGFTEQGGAAALTGFGAGQGVTYSTLGARVSVPFSLGGFTGASTAFRGTLAWQHAFGDITPEATFGFASGPVPFTVAGTPIGTDAALVEAGLDIAFSPTTTFSLFYAGQLSGQDTNNMVQGSLTVNF
ncbi:hypothetical protein GCM10007301_21480 [Azorhizobium oxalatiphilum]|uniref:Autotransporter domain-containing protein n=1 Tax=Azorhizobium oxalatiphilum TaxID=980631 RepID=A0A917FC91_9HYPH|nr:hypothetical protein GCM10007301_21480 [Azorhizobium oxalatiphilum]